jgi:NADP-dependent 3-hydroxy acid dehydrogenase YdfG
MPTEQERIKELEAELAQYKLNGAIGLYYELNRLINETLDLSKSTSLKSLISEGDKKFERMQVLIKNAKEHAIDMEEIKTKLGLIGDSEKDRTRKPFIDRIAEKRE